MLGYECRRWQTAVQGQITSEEVSKAINTMRGGKAPGVVRRTAGML